MARQPTGDHRRDCLPNETEEESVMMDGNRGARLALAAVWFVSLSCLGEDDLTLVDGGKPLASVVIAANASDQLRDTAAVLIDCVWEATGASLPTVNGTDVSPDGAGICIGRSYNP